MLFRVPGTYVAVSLAAVAAGAAAVNPKRVVAARARELKLTILTGCWIVLYSVYLVLLSFEVDCVDE